MLPGQSVLRRSAVVYAHHTWVRPKLRRRRAYRVAAVEPESSDVTTVKLEPPTGRQRYDYSPGQFQFVRFHSESPNVPVEEHHWTISSSPSRDGYVTSTIKASGDFTSNVSDLRVGDLAEVDAPFGRFSYTLYPGESDLVMIAGGIGITPLMAMIRHLHDNGSRRGVTLLYANRTEQDIVFREELEQIAASETPRLSVTHVLSRPSESWDGERGHIDADLIAGRVTDLRTKRFTFALRLR